MALLPYFVLTPERRETPLNVLGTQVTVLASNASTQSYGVTFQRGDEGTGPPPHSHDWDESFYVLGGEVEFLCDGQMLEITGQDAMAAQMFAAIDREIPVGPAPDIPKLLAVLERNGVTVSA
ncbi:hypothetical protein J2W25_000039 [Variovorax boronicumulans]|uniref:Cupin domain-containing protein n=1 Tax=Variovorax boronicumulans TaxID=436515 RepID=A0AAW8DNG8_9BURK|nr:cupin domain-containing protein [Variovorax boronicumulans]MDP9875752.1 hypothetical protein [Variovorax boronicumulans]MDP9919899.1 hypothetical protein [Variovorax boronicumulans]MDP9921034.1 hypothetical protein [Variovorax boronicumulans]